MLDVYVSGVYDVVEVFTTVDVSDVLVTVNRSRKMDHKDIFVTNVIAWGKLYISGLV